MMSRLNLRRVGRTAWVVAIALLATAVLVPSAPSAQTKLITIKMATSVPVNSSWFLVLKEVADKWLFVVKAASMMALLGSTG